MVKPQFTEEDDALLAELGIEVEAPTVADRTPREERIIAGFEEIERFVETHGRPPLHGEGNDIFERLYAVRLDKIRASEECRTVLAGLDTKGLLNDTPAPSSDLPDELDDEALLAELGITTESESDITKLRHVRPRAEIKAAEEIAQRTPCADFAEFKPLFEAVQHDLKQGTRITKRFRKDAGFAKADIQQGHFMIVGGQTAYVAKVGERFKAPNGDDDARLRVIYSNGTESDILLRSLIRAMYKDETSRLITERGAGPLFSDEAEDNDVESGTIYVLRSNSDNPYIKENRDIIHKIGVTGGEVKKRFANVKNDPTFLMADVEVVATYKLSNINRVKLENLIHKFFHHAKLDVQLTDRFGKGINPREWFLVPLFIIDEMVEKIRQSDLSLYYYDIEKSSISHIHDQ
jgi:hypothetical protein